MFQVCAKDTSEKDIFIHPVFHSCKCIRRRRTPENVICLGDPYFLALTEAQAAGASAIKKISQELSRNQRVIGKD